MISIYSCIYKLFLCGYIQYFYVKLLISVSHICDASPLLEFSIERVFVVDLRSFMFAQIFFIYFLCAFSFSFSCSFEPRHEKRSSGFLITSATNGGLHIQRRWLEA